MTVESTASTPEAAPATPAAPEAPTPAPAPASMADAIASKLGMADAPAGEAAQAVAPATEGEQGDAADPLRAPDGKFAKKGNDAKPPLKPDGKQPEPAKTDDDLTAMPEGLSDKGQRRFQKLVSANKELSAKVDAFAEKAESFDSFQQVLREHRVQPEQFDIAVSFIGAINRGDVNTAYRILQEQMTAIAEMTGQELPGVDLLQGHDDLRQAVEQQAMPRQAAAELAARRRREEQLAQAHQQQVQQQQQQQAFQRERQNALQQIDQFLLQMEQQDLDFAAKSAAMEAEIVAMCQELPPSAWPSAVKRMYQAIGRVGRPQALPASPAAGTPLRPAGIAAGARPKPTSMAEAIGAGLGYDA